MTQVIDRGPADDGSGPVAGERRLGRRELLGAALLAGGAATVASAAPAAARARRRRVRCLRRPDLGGRDGIRNEGVGIYTDPSVAFQLSAFTINPRMVSCGVGTLGGPVLETGAFAMLMYSLSIDRYEVDRSASVVRASGLMRSITRVAGRTQEDVLHNFVAIAADRGQPGPDRFDVHFVTPFWTPSNAMATKSTEHPGWVRFGGELVMGEVRVRP